MYTPLVLQPLGVALHALWQQNPGDSGTTMTTTARSSDAGSGIPATAERRRSVWAWILGATGGGLSVLHPGIGAAFLAAGALLWLVVFHVSWAVGALLVIRPMLDFATRAGLPLGAARLNFAAAIGLAVIGVALAFLIDRALRRRPLVWGGAPAAALALLVALAALGTLVGWRTLGPKMLSLGLRETIRMGSLLAFYWLVVNLIEEGMSRTRLVRTLYVALAVPLLAGAAQFLRNALAGAYAGPVTALPPGRLTGTFIHGVGFGIYLALFLLISLTLWGSRDRLGMPRWLLLLVLGSGAVLIVFTWARGAWMFLAMAILAKILLQPRRVIGPMLVVGMLGALFFGDRIAGRFSDIRTDISLRRIVAWNQHQNSFEWRIYNWFVLVNVGLRHPVLGHGTGSTGEVNPILSVNRELMESRGFSAHSEFVGFFVEYGAIGVLLLVVYFCLLLRWLWRRRARFKRTESPAADLADLGLEIVLGFLLISLLTVSPLSGTASYYVVLCLLALIQTTAGEGREPSPPAGSSATPRPA